MQATTAETVDSILAHVRCVLEGQKALEAKVEGLRLGQLRLFKDVHDYKPQSLMNAGYDLPDLLGVGFSLDELSTVIKAETQEGAYSVDDVVVLAMSGAQAESETGTVKEGPDELGKYKLQTERLGAIELDGLNIKGKLQKISFKEDLGVSLKSCVANNMTLPNCYRVGFSMREINDFLEECKQAPEGDKLIGRKNRKSLSNPEDLPKQFLQDDISVKDAGFDAAACLAAGIGAQECYKLGYDLADLKHAHFPTSDFFFEVVQPQKGPYAKGDVVFGPREQKMKIVEGPSKGYDESSEMSYLVEPVDSDSESDSEESDAEKQHTVMAVTDIAGKCVTAAEMAGFEWDVSGKRL